MPLFLSVYKSSCVQTSLFAIRFFYHEREICPQLFPHIYRAFCFHIKCPCCVPHISSIHTISTEYQITPNTMDLIISKHFFNDLCRQILGMHVGHALKEEKITKK